MDFALITTTGWPSFQYFKILCIGYSAAFSANLTWRAWAKAYLVKTVNEKEIYSPLGSLRFLDENAEIYVQCCPELMKATLPNALPTSQLTEYIVFPRKATNL